jgi:hypothetical protein
VSRRLLIAIGILSALASSVVLRRLNGVLLRHHLPEAPSGGMGQGFKAEGLEGGRQVAQQTLTSWSGYDAVHAGITGRSLAYWWLGIDVVFLAIGGYGLLAAVLYQWARESRARDGASGRSQLLGWVLMAAALGLVLVVVDLLENAMAALVIASDGGGPAALLRVWGRAKWSLAVVALLIGLPALILYGLRRRQGQTRGAA